MLVIEIFYHEDLKDCLAPTTSNRILNPSLDFVGTKARLKFSRDCLKKEKITYTHGKIINIYIVYELEKKCKHKQLSDARKLFVWCSRINKTC